LEFEGPGNFWQFSLDNYDSSSINQSRLFIGRLGRGNPNRSEPYPFSPRLQLAMDGKIYVSPGLWTDSLLSVIHCPNSRGYDCQLKFREINLQKGRNGSSFPTLNQTFVRNAGIFQLQASKRSICQSDTLELSGYGAGAERFQWSVSPAFPASVKLDTLTWQKIPTRQLAPGNYTFSCRAFSRCGDVFEKTISVEVKPLPARPIVTTIQKNVPCKGDSVILKVQNPVVGNQYFWSMGDTASFTIVRQTGLYSLDSVSNAVGCGVKVGDTVAVVIKDILVPDEPVLASPQLVEFCEGNRAGLRVKSEELRVVWSNALEGDSALVGSPGKYWAIHQTEEGCTSAASDTIHVVVVPLPFVQLLASDNGHCLGNEETKEYKVISTNLKVKTVELVGGEVVGETDSTISIHWFEGTQTQAPWEAFNIKIKSQNRLGCAGAEVVFSPVPNPEACRELYPLFIPNLVTANHDDHNDRWEMGNILYHQPVSVRIYNRWGQTVFETDSYQNNWPATSLSSGTYFYRVSSFGKEWKGWMEVN
jgi:gliding motility-associated-like protein